MVLLLTSLLWHEMVLYPYTLPPGGYFHHLKKHCPYLLKNIHPYLYLWQSEPFIFVLTSNLTSEFHSFCVPMQKGSQIIWNTPMSWHNPASFFPRTFLLQIAFSIASSIQLNYSQTVKQGQVQCSPLSREKACLTAVGAVRGK